MLDATRCISYLTIELRSAIPEPLREPLANHVYGCDICQEVCPYNQAAPQSDDPAWEARPGLDMPRLIDLWRRSDSDLRALTKGSAMRRAKLTGLRRNLAVALGKEPMGGGIGLGLLIDIATTLSFLSAPILGLLIHRAMFSSDVAPAMRPGPILRNFSLISIVFSGLFALYFLWLRFLS